MRLFEQTFIDLLGDSKAESPLGLQTWSLNGIRSDRLLPPPRMRGALSMIDCVSQNRFKCLCPFRNHTSLLRPDSWQSMGGVSG